MAFISYPPIQCQTGHPVDLYFFDLDNTLYAYNFRKRLPALATLTGVSQCQLARKWWADGYEARAQTGEWPTADSYLDAFAATTNTRRLSLDEWASARASAMTRIETRIEALRRAAALGTVALLSNNPAATGAALPTLIPDVLEIVGSNILLSYQLGARKPDAELYERALAHFGVRADSAFLADDSAANVAGARAVGIRVHRVAPVDSVAETEALRAAIEEFAAR